MITSILIIISCCATSVIDRRQDRMQKRMNPHTRGTITMTHDIDLAQGCVKFVSPSAAPLRDPCILKDMENSISAATLIALTTALGCGVLIGLERERRKVLGTIDGFAGLRSFAITALIGALTMSLQSPWLVALGAACVIALLTIAYARSTSDDRGITTELALFATYVIGVVSVANALLAAGVTVVLVLLLASRTRLHHFATVTLTSEEMADGLALAAAMLIALPLLPDHPIRWLAGLSPYKIGLVIVVLLGIQAIAHVALRTVGYRYGLALAGFLSGFVSSTGTFAAMAARAKRNPQAINACIAGALFSNIASILQLIALVFLLAPRLLVGVAYAFGSMIAVIALMSAWFLRDRQAGSEEEIQSKRLFDPMATLLFGGLIVLFTITIAWVERHFGAQTAGYASVLAALLDLHAAAASGLSVAQAEDGPPRDVLTQLLLMFCVNTAGKVLMSWGGGKAYYVRVTFVLIASLLTGWIIAQWVNAS
jgi:uncharacterized membrane protein (DUF4010 family)